MRYTTGEVPHETHQMVEFLVREFAKQDVTFTRQKYMDLCLAKTTAEMWEQIKQENEKLREKDAPTEQTFMQIEDAGQDASTLTLPP